MHSWTKGIDLGGGEPTQASIKQLNHSSERIKNLWAKETK